MWKEFRGGLPRTLAQPAQLRRVARLSLHYPYVRTWARRSGLRPSTLSRRLHELTVRKREGPVKPVQFGSFRSPVPLGSATDADSVATRYCELFFDGAPYTTDVSDLTNLPGQSQTAVRCYLRRNVAGTIQHLHRILKPSGTLHAILPGVVMASTPRAQDDWRFTPKGASRLFSPLFPGHLEIASRGNPITALAALHRLPASTLDPQDFLTDDPQYPLLITVRATRASP